MFSTLLNRRARRVDDRADALYAAIVAAARRLELFRDLGAPDTTPGRFEVIVLHVALALRALRSRRTPEADALSQGIFDAMFRALDANLREIGVGDLTVPKRIKAMARSFYDGARAYDAALDAEDEQMLASAIGKNMFGDPARDEARALARYAIRADAALAAQPTDALTADGPAFPPVMETAE